MQASHKEGNPFVSSYDAKSIEELFSVATPARFKAGCVPGAILHCCVSTVARSAFLPMEDSLHCYPSLSGQGLSPGPGPQHPCVLRAATLGQKEAGQVILSRHVRCCNLRQRQVLSVHALLITVDASTPKQVASPAPVQCSAPLRMMPMCLRHRPRGCSRFTRCHSVTGKAAL